MRVAFFHNSSSALISSFFSPSPVLPRRLGLGFRETAMAAISGNREPDSDLLLESTPPFKQKLLNHKTEERAGAEAEEEKKKQDDEDLLKKQLGDPPEKPLSGDCCGSGCVRCVWDIYFDELELYNSRKAALNDRGASR